MPAVVRRTRRAFTLIELLVVVAIIALLISILLPSLSCAREKARSAKCGVLLRSFGAGLSTYFTENNDWVPGVNTSGVAATVAGEGGDVGGLRRVSTPVQNYDWMSPILRYETELGANRAEQLQTLINEYRCPSFDGMTIDELYGLQGCPDRSDFTEDIQNSFSPLSYLMPAHFQWWGQEFNGAVIASGTTSSGRPIEVEAMTASWSFGVKHEGRYQSRLDKLGPPARKVAVADGMRYLDEAGIVDFDVTPDAQWFGAFASNGAWWGGSQAYGVDGSTTNWDGTAVGASSASRGQNLVWSYRHGCTTRGQITKGVRDNPGSINTLFFDGHVARMDDKESRNIEYWYPTGTQVSNMSGGLTDVDVPFEVP